MSMARPIPRLTPILILLLICSPLLLTIGGLAALVGAIAFTGVALNAILFVGIHAPAWFLALFIAISGGLVLKGGRA